VFGDRDDVARVEPPRLIFFDAGVIDLDAVFTVVANVPVAVLDEEIAMMGRDVGEPQDDIAAFASAGQELFLK
jgi:hypothetical protein